MPEMVRIRLEGHADVPAEVASAIASEKPYPMEIHLSVSLAAGYGYTIRVPYSVAIEWPDVEHAS